MDVKGIVKEWLKAKGYDGLYSAGECACHIEDLMPCSSEGVMDCKAGYKRMPEEGDDSGYDFFIDSEKRENDESN